MPKLQTSTLTNQNITSALLIGTFTAGQEYSSLMVQVFADQVAGNGNYEIYLTHQIGGAGSAYKSVTTTETLASGETAHKFGSILIPVNNADVVKIYLKGLAGDTTTPDIITEFWDLGYLRPTVAGRTLDVTATGAAGLDWGNIENKTTTNALTNTSISASGLSATVAITATDAAQIADGEFALRTNYTFEQSVTSTITDDLSTARITFAVKTNPEDEDSASLLMFDTTTGLLYVNGAEPVEPVVAGDAVISVTGSSGAWVIALRCEARAMAVLDGVDEGPYPAAIKYSLGNDDLPVTDGAATINAGKIKAL